MRTAVLGDEPRQSEFICGALTTAGHVCRTFASGLELMKQLRWATFDLLILDCNASRAFGEEVLRRVRQREPASLPVIFMATSTCENDITGILDLGADDYVVKPVSAVMLLARVNSLLRRIYPLNQKPARESFGEYEFDLCTRRITLRGVTVAVTQKEFDLALMLFRHLGRPLSRAYILDSVWRRDENLDMPSRTMDTHVSMLRSKLDLRPERGYVLAPVYGYGYRLERREIHATSTTLTREPTSTGGRSSQPSAMPMKKSLYETRSNGPFYRSRMDLAELDQRLEAFSIRVLDHSALMHGSSSVIHRMEGEQLHSTFLSSLVVARRYRRVYEELALEVDRRCHVGEAARKALPGIQSEGGAVDSLESGHSSASRPSIERPTAWAASKSSSTSPGASTATIRSSA